jgi:NADH-quinone oxidoreductase subunit G
LIPYFWSPGWNSIQATNTYQKEVGGPLRGGDAGVRLFERAPGHAQPYFDAIPQAFAPRDGEWLLLPMYHIFGSEELSVSAPGIAELAVKPYVAVNATDLPEGEEVEVTCAGGTLRLPVRIRADLPPGVAGVSTGVSALGGFSSPAWGKIARLQ